VKRTQSNPTPKASEFGAEGCSALLHGADPLLAVQPEVAVGDHAGRLLSVASALSTLDVYA
jgi:hypothetical protein